MSESKPGLAFNELIEEKFLAAITSFAKDHGLGEPSLPVQTWEYISISVGYFTFRYNTQLYNPEPFSLCVDDRVFKAYATLTKCIDDAHWLLRDP